MLNSLVFSINFFQLQKARKQELKLFNALYEVINTFTHSLHIAITLLLQYNTVQYIRWLIQNTIKKW